MFADQCWTIFYVALCTGTAEFINKHLQRTHILGTCIMGDYQINIGHYLPFTCVCTEQLIYISALSKLRESADISAVRYPI